jgi:hypothetical protein
MLTVMLFSLETSQQGHNDMTICGIGTPHVYVGS